MTEWTPFLADDKTSHPPVEGLYRWRLNGAYKIGGANITDPEWVGEASYHGMGYDDQQIFPDGSNWNGYRRTVVKNLEWRCTEVDDVKDQFDFGLKVLPCPFCNSVPAMRWEERPRDGGFYSVTRIWLANRFTLRCFTCFKASTSRDTIPELMESWAQRAYDTSGIELSSPNTKLMKNYWP